MIPAFAPPAPVLLAFRERPFAPHINTYFMEHDLTIAEMLRRIPDPLPYGFDQIGFICVGDVEVPREQWGRTCIKVKNGKPSATVTLGLRLSKGGGGGGGGGGKSTLGTILAVVVLIATVWIGGGGLAAAGLGGIFGAGHIGAILAATAVSVVGGLAVAALTPPPSFDAFTGAHESSSSSAPDSASQGNAAISGNVLEPGGSCPRVFGTHDITPPLLCNPLSERIGDDEYAEAIYGLSGPHKIEDIRLGDTPIESIDNIEWQVVEGLPGDENQDLITRQSFTSQPAVQLTRHRVDPDNPQLLADQNNPSTCLPTWNAIATRKEPNECWVLLVWSEGLADYNNAQTKIGVPVRFRFRLRGETAWTQSPEIHFASSNSLPMQKVIKFVWGTTPIRLPLAPTNEGPYLAFNSVPDQTVEPAGGGWQADPYFGNATTPYTSTSNTSYLNVSLEQNSVTFWLDETIYPKGIYEIQIMTGTPYTASDFTASSYTYSGVKYNWFGYWINGANLQLPRTKNSLHDICTIQRVSSIWNELPIAPTCKDFATISIRVKNRNIENVRVKASGYVRDWNGTEWASAYKITSNPAPHLVDILTNSKLVYNVLPFSLIDNRNLVDWRQLCIDKGYTVDVVVDGRNVLDVASIFCSCGYARLRMSETWGVIMDRSRAGEAPNQIFTPRNTSSMTFEKAFPTIPAGFRVSFDDINDDYTPREIVVLRPGAVDTGIYTKMRYDGIVTEEAAIARAKFDMQVLISRMAFYKSDGLIDHIVATRGDLVGLNTDFLHTQMGFSRISQIVTDDDDPTRIVGFTLDGTVPMPSNAAFSNVAAAFSSYTDGFKNTRMGLLMRQKDGSKRIVEVTPTAADEETNALDVVYPFRDPGSDVLAVGCLVSTGPLGLEVRRMLLYAVIPQKDMTAQLTFVDEAPELFPTAITEVDNTPLKALAVQ